MLYPFVIRAVVLVPEYPEHALAHAIQHLKVLRVFLPHALVLVALPVVDAVPIHEVVLVLQGVALSSPC
jgi:hypothetical protein